MAVRKSAQLPQSSDDNSELVEFVNPKRHKSEFCGKAKAAKSGNAKPTARFLGPPLSKAEAARRWPKRYPNKKSKKAGETPSNEKARKSDADDGLEDDEIADCVAHYLRAEVEGCTYELGDCVHVNAGKGLNHIGRIVELFETADGCHWFSSQWFFRARDTAIHEIEGKKHDKKRVFFSKVKDNNLLDCIVNKIKIIRISPLHHFNILNPKPIPPCDYYYDMGYDYAYSRFYKLPDAEILSSDSDSTVCNDVSAAQAASGNSENKSENEVSSGQKSRSKAMLTLLDLYSGCGGMSSGLCMGASLSGANLVTKWALDLNPHACESLRHNHPETEVRNEAAEDFLKLIKEWQTLCDKFCGGDGVEDSSKEDGPRRSNNHTQVNTVEDDSDESSDLEDGEFEVEKMIGIRYVGSNGKKSGLEFKVHWKGYGPSEDSWEPLESLGDCEDCLKTFVIEGKKAHILPLPGDVDVICGGPPCQGASGFNRFRNKEKPLEDARNKQIVVYMDIVSFLRPRFVLMENVVDILKFAGGVLGRYALSRLVQMHYQATLGLMVAGCYGLPQFRMRVFLWGASPMEKLPPYPLPTHDVVQKGGIPQEWERNVVAYDETQKPKLLKKLTLGDALSDLPAVENSESRDEMTYGRGARTEFQRYIRLPKQVLTGASALASCKKQKQMLYDHRPLQLNVDDYQRTCRIPKEKGANFRDLPGVIVTEDKTVALDPSMKRILLPSGKPLVPDYAISFVRGRSPKPFGRLWWDETVPTVVTRAEPHNQIILHPVQDRVLTIRENARLQGFPDYYKLFGPVKERYIQVGNAVAVPVGRALGYTLGLAIRQSCPPGPVMELPPKYPQGLMSAANQIAEIPLDLED